MLLNTEVLRDNGYVIETEFVNGIMSARTGTDLTDVYNFATRVAAFDSNGVLTDLRLDYDDGLRVETSFVNGLLASKTITDVVDSFQFTSKTTTYDAAGVIQSKLATMDNGRTSETTFVNGVRATREETDVADAFEFNSRVTNYDSAGEIVSELIEMDSVAMGGDGSTSLINYVDGIRSTRVNTDVEDQYDWQRIEFTYDALGNLVSRTVVPDDVPIV